MWLDGSDNPRSRFRCAACNCWRKKFWKAGKHCSEEALEAFGEFDATPITEQLRRNEPATLGRGNYTQGIETRYVGLAANQGDSTSEASEWEPWREGTRTHARFVKIAHETVGAGGAAPVNPAADMPGVLTLNRAAMRMDAG